MYHYWYTMYCSWYSLINIPQVGSVPKKCSKLRKKGIYCPYHTSLSTDFDISEAKMCSSSYVTEFVPVSYEQTKNILTVNHINIKDHQRVVKPHKTMADLSDPEYIILDDGTMYNYGKESKKIKLSIRTYCNNKSLIKYKDQLYCKICYEKYLASKINGPAIITLQEKEQLLLDYEKEEEVAEGEGEVVYCSAMTKKNGQCKCKAISDGFCNRHKQ